MSKIDYAFKSKVLRDYEELFKEYKLSSKYTFALLNFETYGVVTPFLKKNYGKLQTLREAKLQHAGEEESIFQEVIKIEKAKYSRAKRLSVKIENMLNKASLLDEKCLFLTITFNNDTLGVTSAQTRRKYVTLFLKSYCDCYVANIDFGKKNGREHYHAVVLPYTKINFNDWKYGCINFEYIHTPNSRALAKYTAKLTNHAIKETTKRCATIYSRG